MDRKNEKASHLDERAAETAKRIALPSVRRSTAIPFGVGFGVIFADVIIVYLTPVAPALVVLLQLSLVPFGIALLLLVAEAIRTEGQTRWLNLLAVAVLLLMFSGLAILSIGLLTLPVALSLLFLSGWKLTRAVTRRTVPR